jgi:ADP-heptose:LPS heptosyltransferase
VSIRRVLVIRLGAFGDFFQSFPAFAAIRAHHRDAQVTLLTTAPFVEIGRKAPWFDVVWSEGRPRWTDLPAVLRLARRLRQGRFERVYDLQTSRRSSLYRLMVGREAEWSGIARGASHRHDTPGRTHLLTRARQEQQLRIAGLTDFPEPETGWLEADIAGLGLPPRFWLMVPGASARAPEKRWPVERFAALASALPIAPVVVGGPAEAPLAATILQAVPGAVDLCGERSPPAVLAALARRAAFAIGNDTGPTHLLAVFGCPVLALFGRASDPARHAPQGRAVAVLRKDPLVGLEPEEVLGALAGLVDPDGATGHVWTVEGGGAKSVA